MAADYQPDSSPSFAVRSDQPLLGVLVEEGGEHLVRYFAGDVPAQGEPGDDVIADALGLAGAWSDLDWERTAEELDRIRHAVPPTPPIDPEL